MDRAISPRRPNRGATLRAATIGEAWLDIARLILADGVEGDWEGLPFLEIELATLEVADPDPGDPLIARHANAEQLAWMRSNFTQRTRVAALGDARSYASRLFDYAGAGRDQLAWVVERLRRNPSARDATITTFEPLTDTTYIPCVSLLDFWLRAGRLNLAVYAHSIDFGKKGFGNLVQLAELQRTVAQALDSPVGSLTMVIKSAHIYLSERELMATISGT